MKKLLYVYIILLVTCVFPASAQHSYSQSIRFENQSTVNRAEKITVRMDIDITDMHLPSTEMLVLTPVLRAEDGAQTLDLPSVVINGSNRQKAYDRGLKLRGKTPVEGEILEVVKKSKGTTQVIAYSHTVPASAWMNGADVILKESVFGCANCDITRSEIPLLKVEKPFEPEYAVTYIEPEVEPVKARSDSHSATFNYVVDRYELLRDFGNNAKELAAVDKIISEVKANPDISITDFTIAGYASPEGNFEHNRVLALNRANSFADYLTTKHAISRNQFKVNGYGEDWKGLREAIQASDITDKTEVLRIIDNASIAPDAKDAELLKLSGGSTYRKMLQSYYPPLRRTEYTIAYIVRAFDVEEAKEIIKKNPKLLSLNEMYLVAQTYPANSNEFKEVFDIASRMYPDAPIAIINSAATDIEGCNYQMAIDRLSRIESDPRAWNNLGVAYTRIGDTEKAFDYFRKAAANNDTDAIKNAQQLEKYLNEQ